MNAAIATALTRTAVLARDAEKAELLRDIDRPTEYTQRGIYVKSAKANDLEARVWYGNEFRGKNTPQARYLYPQIHGGERAQKRFERALQARGMMPAGWVAVPGPGARLDGYGNVSAGQIRQILAQLGSSTFQGRYSKQTGRNKAQRRKTMQSAGGQYVAFAQPRGKMRAGIYLANGRDFGKEWGFGRSGRLLPVFFFLRSVRYSARYRFYETAQQVVAQELQGQAERAIMEQAQRLAARDAAG
jgi:hypothetical protein